MTKDDETLRRLPLVRADQLMEDGMLPPRAEDYALLYRRRVHKVPAGSRVELDLFGDLRIITDVNETRN